MYWKWSEFVWYMEHSCIEGHGGNEKPLSGMGQGPTMGWSSHARFLPRFWWSRGVGHSGFKIIYIFFWSNINKEYQTWIPFSAEIFITSTFGRHVFAFSLLLFIYILVKKNYGECPYLLIFGNPFLFENNSANNLQRTFYKLNSRSKCRLRYETYTLSNIFRKWLN